MLGAELFFAVRADQEQVSSVRGRHLLDEGQTCFFGPVQIVEEEHDGMLLGGEDLDECTKAEMDAVLRREDGRRRLRTGRGSQNTGKMGNQGGYERSVRAERRAQRLDPPRALRRALDQERSKEA